MEDMADFRVTYRPSATGRVITGGLAAVSLAAALAIYEAGCRDRLSAWSAGCFAVAIPMLSLYLFADVRSQQRRLPANQMTPVMPLIGATAALGGLSLLFWSLSWVLGAIFVFSAIASASTLWGAGSANGVEHASTGGVKTQLEDKQ